MILVRLQKVTNENICNPPTADLLSAKLQKLQKLQNRPFVTPFVTRFFSIVSRAHNNRHLAPFLANARPI